MPWEQGAAQRPWNRIIQAGTLTRLLFRSKTNATMAQKEDKDGGDQLAEGNEEAEDRNYGEVRKGTHEQRALARNKSTKYR